jgi:hypothetical protein
LENRESRADEVSDRDRRLTTRQAIVVTDFDVQGMCLTRHVERYFVALDETRVHLEQLGVPPACVDGDPASAAP